MIQVNSSRIEEMKRKRELEYKAKKSQKKFAWMTIAIALVILLLILDKSIASGWTWGIGLFIGYTLQRSKFCFAASFRDPILVGSTSVMRAIIVAFMIMTLGFGAVHFITHTGGGLPVGQIEPAGFGTAVGAVLFGIGMVVAGGCASGTLMRIGEGFLLQIVVLSGFIIGTLLAANTFDTWDHLLIEGSKVIYIPDLIGLPASIGIQLIVLSVLYKLLNWYDKKHSMLID